MLKSALAITLFLGAALAEGRDWPQFRGPEATAIADAAGVPATWSGTQNVAWAIDVPGDGWSAPIVVGDRAFLTTAVPAQPGSSVLRFETHCYDVATGELLWKRSAREGEPREPTHRDNTFASETPVTDGERVYSYFGMNALACYDLSGEPVWQKDLGAYPMDNGWGTSSSPAVADGKLFVQIDNEADSHLVALNTNDGSEAWRVERPGEDSNWSTPVVWNNSQRTELVVGGRTIRSYDLASGEELWSMEIGGRSSATATPIGDVLYVGSEDRSSRGGTAGGLFAVKAGASGAIDVTDPNAEGLAWANLRGAIGIASPLVYDGFIYVPERRGGVVRVHDAATGEQVNRKRLPGGGVFWASPLAIDGRVLVMDEGGKTFVLEPGAELKVLEVNELDGRFWSTPAVVDGALLIRSQRKLYCVRAAGL
ncbi:outer membrane biogenesis protein BamB [Botrimarina colliarenosi]|uniref:Outer membrane biogenesis protein BamB n=1 Tax=Botrimarina colliarenosi TaxID=2528001 RepID=A0A5C6A6Y3_9BACT|nr:PQQ-binding-like beta-propeller repeat protein [Botrimarina colliarenosi]TWT95269.1 outer membrane biogenesis protein BamB [Botrimarina colliarenosi]